MRTFFVVIGWMLLAFIGTTMLQMMTVLTIGEHTATVTIEGFLQMVVVIAAGYHGFKSEKARRVLQGKTLTSSSIVPD